MVVILGVMVRAVVVLDVGVLDIVVQDVLVESLRWRMPLGAPPAAKRQRLSVQAGQFNAS